MRNISHHKYIQKYLISCVGNWIRKQIIQNVLCERFFSVSADEAADCSNKEQLPLVLSYGDEANEIQERFVDFILCDTGVTGRALADKILEALQEYGLDVGNIRGQAYDGAGSMADNVMVLLLASNQLAPKQRMSTVLHIH